MFAMPGYSNVTISLVRLYVNLLVNLVLGSRSSYLEQFNLKVFGTRVMSSMCKS